MPTVAEIRIHKRQERLTALRQALAPLLHSDTDEEVWLFGSLARGDWDACSDVDLIAVAASQEEADALGDRFWPPVWEMMSSASTGKAGGAGSRATTPTGAASAAMPCSSPVRRRHDAAGGSLAAPGRG